MSYLKVFLQPKIIISAALLFLSYTQLLYTLYLYILNYLSVILF